MSGAAILLFLLSYCQVFAYDEIQPPEELNISVPTLGKAVLTWKSSVNPQNKTIRYLVNVNAPEWPDILTISKNTYTLVMVALHRGFTAQVAAQIDGEDGSLKTRQRSKWLSKSLPPYPGVEGTSASDLSCQIEIEASGNCSLSCRWAPGDTTPADTEYNLYYRYGDVIERCQNYVTEAGGQRRIGCRILSSVMSPNNPQTLLVHINGTSRSLKIRAMEKIFYSSNIEIIPPVQNLTLNVSSLHWIKPVQSLPHSCFEYEVNIRSKYSNNTTTVVNSRYLNDDLHNPANRQFIRVRAVGKIPCWTHKPVSQWTDTIEIGEDVDRGDTLVIIVFVCLIVAFTVVFLLCNRFWRHIFPPIPKPKNDLKEAFQNLQSQALMRCNSWDTEEVISYIEEIIESNKYKTSSVGMSEY